MDSGRRHRWLMLVLLAAIISLVAQPLAAQNSEITGTVTDPTGAVIAGASVTILNTATNQVRTATTNETGNYSVPFLVPGIYNVTAETAGFKVSARNRVDLQVGQVARIDFRLEIGQVTEQVEVTGGAPLLATETTALGTVIENRRIVELPLNGRNYLQMITLSPNVTTEGGAGGGGGLQGGARTRASYSVAGQRLEFLVHQPRRVGQPPRRSHGAPHQARPLAVGGPAPADRPRCPGRRPVQEEV